MKSKLIVVNSITQALKAKSELENNKIPCKIEKTKPQINSHSCAYAIKVSAKKSLNAVRIIRNSGIEVVDIIDYGYDNS